MLSGRQLKQFVAETAAMLARRRDLSGYEIYASSSEQIVARLNCTGDIASRGVEEAKSHSADGFALRVITGRNPRETGAAFVAGDPSMEGVRRALAQALSAAVVDPHFPGLPSGAADRLSRSDSRPELLGAPHMAITRAAWDTLEGALAELARRTRKKPRPAGLIIGGDFTLTRERIAVGSSALPAIQSDQDAYFSASITVLVEELDAKATASAAGRSPLELTRCQGRLGREAVIKALAPAVPVCPPSGEYRVLIGPQPLAEILSYMVIPSLTTGAFYRADSAYQGRFGSQVMDPRISLVEDPAAPRGAIRRRITCEGLPARRTYLVRDGRLTGLLSNFYDARRLMTDSALAEKLGESAPAAPEFAAANGYRISINGGRSFETQPHASASNVIMAAPNGINPVELIRTVKNGILVGRVWYTYPINGQRAGDFTCTVSGDSYLIEDGRITSPIAPNCLRINAHIDDIFAAPAAVGSRLTTSFVWGQPEIFYLPSIAVEALPLASVSDTV